MVVSTINSGNITETAYTRSCNVCIKSVFVPEDIYNELIHERKFQY